MRAGLGAEVGFGDFFVVNVCDLVSLRYGFCLTVFEKMQYYLLAIVCDKRLRQH
uniref:Uncharacterized protein n=1 Tax=Anguilla anguilla TaxID=7936 RepID=A0A0E9SQ42_ANGAN